MRGKGLRSLLGEACGSRSLLLSLRPNSLSSPLPFCQLFTLSGNHISSLRSEEIAFSPSWAHPSCPLAAELRHKAGGEGIRELAGLLGNHLYDLFLGTIFMRNTTFSQPSLVGVQRKCGRTFAPTQRRAGSEHSGPAAEPLAAW